MGRVRALVLGVLVLAATASYAADPLTPEQASSHVGEQAQVCGVVASAKFAEGSRGQPTFLNLGRPYPNHVFTALVWGVDRAAFSEPPEALEGRQICVEGVISEYRGRPQIVVSRPSQITSAP
jgi:hypothetical protein